MYTKAWRTDEEGRESNRYIRGSAYKELEKRALELEAVELELEKAGGDLLSFSRTGQANCRDSILQHGTRASAAVMRVMRRSRKR